MSTIIRMKTIDALNKGDPSSVDSGLLSKEELRNRTLSRGRCWSQQVSSDELEDEPNPCPVPGRVAYKNFNFFRITYIFYKA